ncbi:hypothetical protein AVEN_81727-1 [Araneus ventricosus]|uniref:Uncharacterized protein n=1 Tax=Araneus ventricosus TaxID=182803 RepID=A0A4Y2T3H7_ARAVE|nr:hypothetical protein AVEN_81727-1 [Araneus ventricosus]
MRWKPSYGIYGSFGGNESVAVLACRCRGVRLYLENLVGGPQNLSLILKLSKYIDQQPCLIEALTNTYVPFRPTNVNVDRIVSLMSTDWSEVKIDCQWEQLMQFLMSL